MKTVNVENFDVWTPQECEDEFGVFANDLKKSGMYRIETGCRGGLEEVTFLGDVSEIEVEDLEDVHNMYHEWYQEDIDDGEVTEDDVKFMCEEWYASEAMPGIEVTDKTNWVVGITEEDTVCYVKVEVEQ